MKPIFIFLSRMILFFALFFCCCSDDTEDDKNNGIDEAKVIADLNGEVIYITDNYDLRKKKLGGPDNIWVFDAFSTHPHDNPDNLKYSDKNQLISTVSYLDWSSDGSKIVYSGSSIYDGIHIINADGSGNRKIKANGFAPSWMSNNKQIIYTGVTNVINTRLIFGLFVSDTDDSYEIDLKIKGRQADCK